ncbi:M20/M25/M40 family metallo-hydrolase [Salinarimonas soli]|uniref:M20/M25/M40 family metallo-hydrolase n=1 Tax=Salinarimonas soli TaxID=1638099 RepID=A0A5B2VS16_9HYPH|nr:M20/M25/M40 family metallo-hydrolase [Salinarimonas soli]KAA2241042.1 M20/M25/M40 family metallo-hydrolase [Salinarimonas soli]
MPDPTPSSHDAAIRRLMESPAYASMIETLRAEHQRTVDDIVTLTEIPSPPFGEAPRAEAYRAMLESHGLADVEADREGNVFGVRRGSGNGEVVVLAAHLDTVFPAGTDVRVRREGTRLLAPGVGDDTRSLAVLLAWLRAMDAAGVKTQADIVVLGDVGEEGPGDLRGVRRFFAESRYRDRVRAFVTVDGPDMDTLVTGGIASRRFRATFRGPGGHSLMDFGTVNPMHALAQTVLELSRVAVPRTPRTTHAATVVSGGTSVNAIPNAAALEVDLRSESMDELERLDRRFRAIVAAAVEAENHARSTANGAVTVELTIIGDRPGGQGDRGSDLVRFALAGMRAHGFEPDLVTSSTDANIPLSLGIPAIRVGSGGQGGRYHSLDEWIDVEPEASVRGMAAGLVTALAVAGVVEG